MADNTQLPVPTSSGDVIAADDIAGVKYQRVKVTIGADGVDGGDISISNPLPVEIQGALGTADTRSLGSSLVDGDIGIVSNTVIHGKSTGGGGSYVDVKVNPSGALAVSVGESALPTGAATETTLDALNDKFVFSTDNPSQTVSALPVRQAPQKYWFCGFSKVGSGLQTDKMTLIQTGGGQTVAQSAGNLTITCGTTANSETVIRSIETFRGAMQLVGIVTSGTRNTLNDLFIELVDVIGDGLSFTINSTTSVTVTKTAHGFTSADVGQRMDIGALSLSTCPPQEAVIASIPTADTITFTVAGFPASGSGTCSLWGYNKYELRYTSATATNLAFNVRRKGWQNTAVTATINTSASGHTPCLVIKNGVASLSDKTLAAGNAFTNRTAWDVNCPDDDVTLYLQIRCRNGTSAPASLVWTIGGVRVSDYTPNHVELIGVEQQSIRNSLPVSVISSATVAVSGSLTSAGTTTNTPVTPTTTFTNSAATTNGTVIKASAGTLWNITATNINAAVRYLKLYNSTTVTVGTTTPVLTIAIPAGGSVNYTGGSNGLRFATGICLGITTGAADNDTGAVAANEIKVATSYT